MRTPAVVLVSVLLLQGCSVLSIDLQPRIRPLKEETVEGKGTSKILLMDVSGVLSDETGSSLSLATPPPKVPVVARVREELQKAEEDQDLKALIVRINSPGGTITASDLIYREVVAFKQRKKVPLIVQSRRVPEDRVRAFADGRIYTAEQAKALGLVDSIGYMDDAVAAARKAAGVEQARVVMYHRPREYRSNFYSTTPPDAPGIEASLGQLAGAISGAGPRLMYLWWP